MGDFKVRKVKDAYDREKMYRLALNDIEAFELMLKNKQFVGGKPWIGAEQELCLVDPKGKPATTALEVLKSINDPHFTNELALFNLEINLDPLPLAGPSFEGMHTSLLNLMQKGYDLAPKYNSNLLMTGILPTLQYHHLQFEYMTPEERYRTISNTLMDIRGKDFEIYLQGVDEIIMSLDSVLFEACNTSFQLHLQIESDEFVNKHNWSQMISGPVLAGCVNSPLLFGNELWAETRVALFKQSLDTRSSQKFLRKKLPRVYFGNDWIKNSAADLWKNDISRFPLVVSSDELDDSMAILQKGEIPDLRAIRLHNGTTYTWNRLCYGFSKKQPHLRIECRYLPSGPTAIDEIANFAFWIGLMEHEPPGGKEFWKNIDFKEAKYNFIKAARSGLSTVFNWMGEYISARRLILDHLLPMAEEGLKKSNVAPEDIKKYLGVFEKRIRKDITGSEWTVRNYRKINKEYSDVISLRELVKQMLVYQKENTPLYEWEDYDPAENVFSRQKPRVEQIMTKDVLSVQENQSLLLVKNIMKWHNIHHLPVEDENGDLVGLITDGIIERMTNENQKKMLFAKDIMISQLTTVHPTEPVVSVHMIMKEKNLSGLPVVYKNKLIGIITIRDIEREKSAVNKQEMEDV